MQKAFWIWLIGLVGMLIGLTLMFNQQDPATVGKGLTAAQLPTTVSSEEPTAPPLDVSRIKVVALDNFGTVYDLSATPKEEIRDYIQQVRRPEWAPLDLPDSWRDLKAFPDAAEGILRLRKRYTVVTCANASSDLLWELASKNRIHWNLVIPLEVIPAYKPDPRCYELVANVAEVPPHEVLIVTGNEGSPDLTVPLRLGMQTIRIRGESGPKDLLELAELLGCGDE